MRPKQFDLTRLFETPFREAWQPADPWCRFHHSRRWHLEAFEQPIEGRPAEASPLTAPIEPLEQNATGFGGGRASQFLHDSLLACHALRPRQVSGNLTCVGLLRVG